MISLATARQLKQAGLRWQPKMNDFFAIPDRDMDQKVFVISDMLATYERFNGLPVIAFQGSAEWALDNLVADEIVWLPTETQLRQALETELLAGGRPELHLYSGLDGCRCSFQWRGQALSFSAGEAEEVYAAALIFLIQATSG